MVLRALRPRLDNEVCRREQGEEIREIYRKDKPLSNTLKTASSKVFLSLLIGSLHFSQSGLSSSALSASLLALTPLAVSAFRAFG